MRSLPPIALLVALAACEPQPAPAPAPKLELVGVVELFPPGYSEVEAVLEERAPGVDRILRKQLAIAIAEEARTAHYDPLLVLALIDVESEYKSGAVSAAGAKGLMQIRPATLQYLALRAGLKPAAVEKDPVLTLRLGVRYLHSLDQQFGNLNLALMAYNMGPNRLRDQLKKRELERFRGYPRAVRKGFLALREGPAPAGDWTLAARNQR